jgi:hypothetical protein
MLRGANNGRRSMVRVDRSRPAVKATTRTVGPPAECQSAGAEVRFDWPTSPIALRGGVDGSYATFGGVPVPAFVGRSAGFVLD